MPLNSNESLRIVSLISIGKHPQSGRERRADQDARAVELGLALSKDRLTVLHVGDAEQAALRQYAGMGLDEIQVLEAPSQADALIPLTDYMQEHAPTIILTGVRAESGESSGMVPYLLAEKLGWPMVPRIADIVSINDGMAEVLQALPRGQRRVIKVALPFIASVDTAAPEARQSAFGPASRAALTTQICAVETDDVAVKWAEAPARKRPKRLKIIKAKTAAERFKAATAKPQGESGKVLIKESDQEKAQEILNLLVEEKVFR
ncbi:electron transfer flavoprotein subunit beta [Marinomonas sp. 2405UD68-3]|uniref:electron transfer flavoprotein subunit beta n=1 Tax=Marinomonas sp. 2405UD68-3 TaxID=3391835 RepID=UPI0039C9DF8C